MKYTRVASFLLFLFLFLFPFCGFADAWHCQGNYFHNIEGKSVEGCKPLRASQICGSDGRNYITPSRGDLPLQVSPCPKNVAKGPMETIRKVGLEDMRKVVSFKSPQSSQTRHPQSKERVVPPDQYIDCLEKLGPLECGLGNMGNFINHTMYHVADVLKEATP